MGDIDRASSDALSVLSPGAPVAFGGEGCEARRIVWPGVGARHRSMHLVTIRRGGTTAVLRHPTESVYYVLRGEGSVSEVGDDARHPLDEGSVVHVDPETPYRIEAASELELIGGPCPPDPALYGEEETR